MKGHQTRKISFKRNDKALSELKKMTTDECRLDLIRSTRLRSFSNELQKCLVPLKVRLVRSVHSRFGLEFTASLLARLFISYL